MNISPEEQKRILIVSGAVFIIALFYFLGFLFSELYSSNKYLELKLNEFNQISKLTGNDLIQVKKENVDLNGALTVEKGRNDAFESQINQINGTVANLLKLKSLDPELLRKYSKVYFLNDNYKPTELSFLNSEYLYNQNKPQQIHARALIFLNQMLQVSAQDGVKLQVLSAYRSFEEQASVKYGYKVLYGAGANQFSADQGYSEHQLGTACDFTTPEVKDNLPKFKASKEYKWLTENAYKYGFVISYPENNSYYEFEPWHWRFVGRILGTKLHDENKYFYDLTQREIDLYLINIFD